MSAEILSSRELEFLLYEFFDVESLVQRDRFADHNKETFDAVIKTSKTIAEKVFLPMRAKTDQIEPTFDGEKVTVIPELKEAVDAVSEAGLASGTCDYELGGMQLPITVSNAAMSYLSAAGGTTLNYVCMTIANANLMQAYGTEEQIEKWVKPMRDGRFAGTMAMTEPGAGSGIADLTAKAVKQPDGTYRIFGSKIFTSGGDHELNENIVHLVLARVEGAPKGVKGISLFIVPKYLLNDDGSIGEKNDVALTGLFHKMGGRAQTTTALSFGENEGAEGYIIGEENAGLKYMFHMMNEARILAGCCASVLGLTAYQYSLDYAKERPQGRLLSEKDPHSKPVNIIEHPDVRRMLLLQKAYAEGAFALCLFGSTLIDDSQTAESSEDRQKASLLLDLLTPVIKAWPAEYCLQANQQAIQVLGGHGYINEHPVEFFYRENRANSIHEGTTGIQSLDLLARKVPMKNFTAFKMLLEKISATIVEASEFVELEYYADKLKKALETLQATTMAVMKATEQMDPDKAFSNSVSYLKMFGHVLIAWIWLQQARLAISKLQAGVHDSDEDFYRGKIHTMKYFFNHELPSINNWSRLIASLDDVCFEMKSEWF